MSAIQSILASVRPTTTVTFSGGLGGLDALAGSTGVLAGGIGVWVSIGTGVLMGGIGTGVACNVVK